VSAVTNSFSLVSFHRFFPVLLLAGLVSACTGLPRAPETGAVVSWSQLPGWRNDRPAEAWPALLQTCQKLPVRDARWRELCAEAALFPDPDDDIARAFFETRFEPRVLRHGDGADGLITGYYEPLLNGSLTKTERFRYPIYQPPKDLLTVDIGEVYPELRGKTLRGRVAGKRVVPYFSRAEITHGGQVLTGNELVWVDDAVALFFLQVQGSGRVRLPDGTLLFVGYADQNGHPYQAIGRRLVELGALQVEEVNLESIRAWLKAHPQEAEGVLNSNPSYVFFLRRESNLPGPLGSLNVPLTRERSIAVDPAYIPLGAPVWLDTTLDNSSERPYRRLMFAQDTGGAIKGAVRADVFFGFGDEAERRAGAMKSRGRLYVLWPQRYRVAGD
jgi:membrane-bound lytic murein transglycosylase A